jgi:hypothetical protein
VFSARAGTSDTFTVATNIAMKHPPNNIIRQHSVKGERM